MDARRGLAALLGQARPLHGPAARAAIAAPPAVNPAATQRGQVVASAGASPLAPMADPRDPAPATCRRHCRPRPESDLDRRPAATGANPLATGLTLKPAPLEPTDLRFPINLATALRLSDARPLIVAAAQASVWVAEAELTRAKVLWIPDAQHRLRLHPPRRRRPGLQQGHHDRARASNFFYGGAGLWGTSPRPTPSSSPWSRGRS